EADIAEEHDDIMIGVAGDVYVAEEDDHVVIDRTLGLDAAEEADRVVHRLIGANDDFAAELNGVAVGKGRQRSEDEGCEQRKSGEGRSEVHSALSGGLRWDGRKSSRMSSGAEPGREQVYA